MNKVLLITGSTGFIGQYVLKILEKENFNIHILVRNKPKQTLTNYNYHTANLADLNRINTLIRNIKPTHLLHLAWDVKQDNYANSLDNIAWITYSANLIDKFIAAGGKHIIGAGTCFEYDLNSKHKLDENSPCVPNTIYGKCKLELHNLIRQKCIDNNVRLAWGRVFYPYGIGEEERKLFSAVIKTLKNNQEFICKTPNNIIDYVHVRDVADIFCRLITNDEIAGIINICSGNTVKLSEILQHIASKLNKEHLLNINDTTEGKHITGSTNILANKLNKETFVELQDGINELIENICQEDKK